MTPTENISAALVSVGGSAAPVLFTLRQHRPAHVWYFCSAGSRAIADAIHSQLDWPLDRDFVEVECFEELGPCYRELRHAIPALLKKWKVPTAEVLVDYTGGTKTMSAALVLAASEVFQQFSYVGGEQREKGGLGVTVDGRERVLYQGNPWSELATREIERAQDLWASCQFDGATKVLREVATRVPHRLRFEAVADVADAMAARHRLDFLQAFKLLSPLVSKLPPLFGGLPDHGLRTQIIAIRAICDACSKDAASESFLREILDNALRTADQGRFEDAAARLYRAMEMQGHLWLAETTGGLFVNGRCKAENAGRIPEALRALPFCQPAVAGASVDLSMELSFRALHALGEVRVARMVEDIAMADSGSKSASRWRRATEKRNTSILAHGVQPIGEDGFAQMKQLATEFLGFQLEQEANPILPLDLRWL